MPPRTRLKALAKALGMPIDELSRIVDADRKARRMVGREASVVSCAQPTAADDRNPGCDVRETGGAQ